MDNDSTSRLKAAIYLDVAKTVENETEKMGVTATPSYVASLVELVYNQLVTLGTDLESFADHASRSNIKPADLYMVTRKNELLTEVLKEHERSLK